MSRLVLVKVYGAVLLGLALCAGLGANAATITTGKIKHRSAGTTRVATKLTAHTLCIYLNRLLGNADFLKIKALAFPNN